jgi:hypothetical protein
MKKMRQIVLLILLASGSAAQAVGNVQGATVVNVDSRADGNFLITFSQSSTTPPSCVTVFNRMSGTTNTAGGKAVLATAMLAYATGARVALAQGTGACNPYDGIESIIIFSMGQ